jgi:hypothetical protein
VRLAKFAISRKLRVSFKTTRADAEILNTFACCFQLRCPRAVILRPKPHLDRASLHSAALDDGAGHAERFRDPVTRM